MYMLFLLHFTPNLSAACYFLSFPFVTILCIHHSLNSFEWKLNLFSFLISFSLPIKTVHCFKFTLNSRWLALLITGSSQYQYILTRHIRQDLRLLGMPSSGRMMSVMGSDLSRISLGGRPLTAFNLFKTSQAP